MFLKCFWILKFDFMTETEMTEFRFVFELCRKEIVLRSRATYLVNFLIVEKKRISFVISARERANKKNGMNAFSCNSRLVESWRSEFRGSDSDNCFDLFAVWSVFFGKIGHSHRRSNFCLAQPLFVLVPRIGFRKRPRKCRKQERYL